MRRSTFQHFVLVLGALSTPAVAFAAAPKTFAELANSLINLINMGVAATIALGFVLYFWGLSTNILKFQDDPEKRKAYFFWGILVLVVILSIWGIVNLIENTLFGGTNPNVNGSHYGI